MCSVLRPGVVLLQGLSGLHGTGISSPLTKSKSPSKSILRRAVTPPSTHGHHTYPPPTRAMPPRIPLAHVSRCCRTSLERATACQPRTAIAPLASLLAGLSLHQSNQPSPSSPSSQIRHASILSNLRDNKGAYNKRIRKGRGASSGYGKTSGRGTKGQGQHGKVKPWFQGGQTPLIFKHGRMGFSNRYVLHPSPQHSSVFQDKICGELG